MVATRMRVGSVVLALVMSLLLVTVGAGPAYACSCADVPLKNDIRNADAVFSGEVRSIDEDASAGSGIMAAPGRINFAVEDSWKGATAETVDVYGQGDGVNCFNSFEEGEAYLVYASRAKGPDAPLTNVACGETKPLAASESDLRLLGQPTASLPETGGAPSESIEDGAGQTRIVAMAALALLAAGAFIARRAVIRPGR